MQTTVKLIKTFKLSLSAVLHPALCVNENGPGTRSGFFIFQ